MKKSKFILFPNIIIFIMCLVLLTIITVYIKQHPIFNSQSLNKPSASFSNTAPSNSKVLAAEAPQVYITNTGYGYSNSSLMAEASTDSPTVDVTGLNYSGDITINIFQASETQLLNFLVHDKDAKQVSDTVDTSTLQPISSLKEHINTSGQTQNILLPISNSGVFYLELKYANITSGSFLVRSDNGVLVKAGDNQMIFWGQNFKTKRSISSGIVKVYNLNGGVNLLSTTSFDGEGIAQGPTSADSDLAIVEQDSDIAIVPINLHYLGFGKNYTSFQPKSLNTRYFIFTDRPIYKPGDTVYFKSIIRNDDDARYTIPQGTAKVSLYSGYSDSDKIIDKSYSISSQGTIDGNLVIPADGKTGDYRLIVATGQNSTSQIDFDVEYYRKPEYSLDITTSGDQFVSKDQASFIIKGSYFSGMPLSNQTISYTINTGNYYDYEYQVDQSYLLNNNYRYGFWGGSQITTGTVTLDNSGSAQVTLPTKIPVGITQDQVFSVEASFDDGSGDPAIANKNVLVYAGEFDIYRRQDSSYFSTINKLLSLPLILVSHRNTKISGIGLSAKVHRVSYIQYQDPNQKYPSYRKEEEDLPSINATTDAQGNSNISFTPTKTGSYQITVSGTDAMGNIISKTFYSYVGSENEAFYFSDNQNSANGLTLQSDQKQYKPDGTAHLTLSSSIPDRDIFLSLERGRVERYQVVHMNGNLASVDIPLQNTDIPNVYAAVDSFSTNSLESNISNLIVSTDSKKIVVNITPDNKKYGPSDNVTVNIQTTDIAGNPISADVALWAVDKALFQLVDNNIENIFDTFWHQRSDDTSKDHSLEGIFSNAAEMGGCFSEDTFILMADGSSKPINQVKIGDFILTRENSTSSTLVKAKVTNTINATEEGYLVFNSNFKVTSNHKIYVNNSWMDADLAQIGDTLKDTNNKDIKINSIEWVRGKFMVYNLTIDKYNTFFADGYYVHNQKGGAGRTVFKDTAYWNPSIQTDSSGHAKVTFKLPDNLTTWVISAISETGDTKAGQNTTEVQVSKDVVVKPILPNVLLTGDDIHLSALVENFSDTDQKFDVNLKTDLGEVLQATQSGILVKSKQVERLYWNLNPTVANEQGKLTFSAKSQSSKLSDSITLQIPVRNFGFSETSAQTGDIPKTYQIKLDSDTLPNKTKVTLSLSPTMMGTLIPAMNYLVDYPYGCVEQTTSRFIPALVVKTYPTLFKDILVDKNVDDIIKQSITRLGTQQQSDGGWTWWFTGDSSPFITSYVVENLLQAKKLGYTVDDSVLANAKYYLETQNSKDTQVDQIVRNYGLTLIGSNKKTIQESNLQSLSPDILSLAVISNYQNGDINPSSNGLTLLESKAKPLGDGVYWDSGDKIHFSSPEASTGLAIKAIIKAKGSTDLAVKAERYLMAKRQTNYWDNTYATSMIIQGLMDLSTSQNELQPNYNYKVLLDGNIISTGTINNLNKLEYKVDVPNNKINPQGSNLEIVKDGDGQIYSTLLTSQFHTDPNSKAVSHGMTIQRSYVNDKGDSYNIGLGDTVTVNLTISGPAQAENYAVITDQLPSGMIPINTSFKNQQYGQQLNYANYYSGYAWDTEYTENGVILSTYQINPGLQTYTYKARVVSDGIFKAPPATVSLMYSPEVYARTPADTVKIEPQSTQIPGKGIQKQLKTLSIANKYQTFIIVILTLAGVSMIALFIYFYKKDNSLTNWIKQLFKKKTP